MVSAPERISCRAQLISPKILCFQAIVKWFLSDEDLCAGNNSAIQSDNLDPSLTERTRRN